MRYFLIACCCFAVICTTPILAQTIDVTNTDAIKKSIGKRVSIKGAVTKIEIAKTQQDGDATLLIFANEAFLAGIYNENVKEVLAGVTDDVENLVGQEVIVTAEVIDDQGELVMVLKKAGDLKLTKAAGPKPVVPKPVEVKPVDADETEAVRLLEGKPVTVRGMVMKTDQSATHRFIFFKHGQKGFHVIIKAEHVAAVLKDVAVEVKELLNKTIDVSGTMEFNQRAGAPAIYLEEAGKIKIVDDAEVDPTKPGKPDIGKPDVPMKLQSGFFQSRYRIRSTSQTRVANMMGKKDEAGEEYDLANESYQIYVPETYRAGLPHALLIWLDHFDAPKLPPWQKVFDNRNIIWASPNKAGSEKGAHSFSRRVALASDLRIDIAKRFTIDPERIYIAGWMDNAGPATALVTYDPASYQGALFLNGVGYYRDINHPRSDNDDDNKKKREKGDNEWLALYPKPTRSWRAAQNRRMVMLVGTSATNFSRCNETYNKGFRAEGFKYFKYAEVPKGTDHLPSDNYADGAIGFLEGIVTRAAVKHHQKAETFDRSKKLGAAFEQYAYAAMRGTNQSWVKDDYKRALEIYGELEQQLAKEEDAIRALIDQRKIPQAKAMMRALENTYAGAAKPIQSRMEVYIKETMTKPKPTKVASGDPVKPVKNTDPPATDGPKTRREQIAARDLERAEKTLAKDLVDGYLAMVRVAGRYRGTEAGTKANQLAKEMMANPKQKKILQPALDERKSQDMLKFSKSYITLKKYDEAYEELRKLIRDYPKSKAVPEAERLMEHIRLIKKKQAEKL